MRISVIRIKMHLKMTMVDKYLFFGAKRFIIIIHFSLLRDITKKSPSLTPKYFLSTTRRVKTTSYQPELFLLFQYACFRSIYPYFHTKCLRSQNPYVFAPIWQIACHVHRKNS
jgi:hypothetical protein